MVKPPRFDSNGVKKGAWSKEEDDILRDYIQRYGHPNWRTLPASAGLARCGKSCRLRWMNYLKPGLRRGNFTLHERDLIIKLHADLGNKWSTIAAYLPGRTDNEVKNYWHAHIQKRSKRKHSSVNKAVIKTEMPKEELSYSEINFCNINHAETLSSDVDILSGLSVENFETIDVVCSTAQNDQECNLMIEEYCHPYRDDSPPFVEEEYGHGNFWLCQEMQNDLLVLSESSDAGYKSTAESQLGDFWAEQLGEEEISWYFDYYIMDML